MKTGLSKRTSGSPTSRFYSAIFAKNSAPIGSHISFILILKSDRQPAFVLIDIIDMVDVFYIILYDLFNCILIHTGYRDSRKKVQRREKWKTKSLKPAITSMQ